MQLKHKIAAFGSAATLFVGNAIAAVPTEVTTSLTDAKTDGITIATAVLVAIIALYAFKLMRRGL